MQSYNNYYTGMGQPVPVGSRTRAYVFGGITCPESVSFGRLHGPSPATCDVELSGNISITAGSKQSVQVDGATFTGYVIGIQTSQNDQTGITTHVKLVDCRERLHGYTTACQLNMLDDKGRWYHIKPSEWRSQTRQYLSTIDLTVSKEEQLTSELDCSEGLLSAYQILNELGKSFSFTLSGSDNALKALKSTKPINTDWNNGVKVIEAIDQIVSYCGLQFTAWGDLNIHITKRGDIDDPIVYRLITGQDNICTLYNAVKFSFGSELNDKGNRVIILGGNNRFQFCYPCYPEWAPGFDQSAIFDGKVFGAKLEGWGLTRLSKMSELWAKDDSFKHDITFKGKKVSDMTVSDYMRTFPFKVFQVLFGAGDVYEDHITDSIIKVDGDNVSNDILQIPHVTTKSYSYFPVADSLITNPNIRFLPKATISQFNYKGGDPLSTVRQRVYFTENCDLEIEEAIIQKDDDSPCRQAYLARVCFSDHRLLWDLEHPDDASKIKIDLVTVQVCLEGSRYMYDATGGDPAIRQRIVVKTDQNLRRNFIGDGVVGGGTTTTIKPNDPDVTIGNYRYMNEAYLLGQIQDPDANSASVKVYASDVARQLASDVVNNDTINSAGYIEFDQVAGMMPSGLIDNVSISFNDQGTSETVNFTTDRNLPASMADSASKRTINLPAKIRYDVNNSAEYTTKQMQAFLRDRAKRASNIPKDDNAPIGGQNAPAPLAAAFNANNSVTVQAEISEIGDDIKQGQIVILSAPDGNKDSVIES